MINLVKTIMIAMVCLAFVGHAAAEPTVYWTDEETGTIQRADLNGGSPEILVMELQKPLGIALDVAAGKMYWASEGDTSEDDAGTIQRANLNGTAPQTLVEGLKKPLGLTLDVAAGKMYWTSMDGDDAGGNKGTIRRANLNGTEVETLVMGLKEPIGIALDLVGDNQGDGSGMDVGVDLAGTITKFKHKVKKSGGDLEVKVRVCNNGTEDTRDSFFVTLFLSDDTLLSDDDFQLTSKARKGKIQPNKCKNITVKDKKIQEPTSGKFVLVVIDFGNAIPESNEDNNTLSRQISAASIAGSWKGSPTFNVTNCTDTEDNGIDTDSLSISFSQNGDTFTGVVNDEDGATTITGSIATDGTVTGTFISIEEDEGEMFQTEGTLTGNVTGSTLTLFIEGQDVLGNTCVFSGSVTLQRS